MSKIFSVNKSFVDYITMMGFEFKETDSEKKYYVNKNGNQIRIDYNNNLITLLNKFGNVVESAGAFSSESIDKFIREE